MKRALLYQLFAVRLLAANYYVSSAGSDANDGSQGSPWLTLQKAVNSVACGDTILVVANGSYVAGDATLPAMPNCALTTTIQSSALDEFGPSGYRTIPANDSARYGKLQFAALGIVAQAEIHGFDPTFASYCPFTIAGSTFTITPGGAFGCGGGLRNLANGSQVEFEINSNFCGGCGGTGFPTVNPPVPLAVLQHYYIVNCGAGCGSLGSTFQVAATPGGAPIAIASCDAQCLTYGLVAQPVFADVFTSTLSSPNAFTSIANGTPVAFAAGGLQLGGALPDPLAQDVIYYVVNLNGLKFQVAAIPGGDPIPLTSIGAGMISVANTDVPHNWAFRGLELRDAAGTFIYSMLTFGLGSETSIYGMVHHMEVDRCYIHDFSNAQNGPRRGIQDNGQYISVHDSWIAGMKDANNDAQGIGGWGSHGPSVILNNFIEASGENTLYGGSWPTYFPLVNQNKLFIGNYYYKPPIWKQARSSGAPTGSCLYDDTDPQHAGGEFYLDTAGSQVYQCQSNNTWTTVAGTLPLYFGVKNMAEHKNGRNFLFWGNFFNFSWADQQSGQVFAFHQRENSGPGFANDHITAMNNKAINVFKFMTTDSDCGQNLLTLPCPNGPAQIHTIVNNLAVIGDTRLCGVGPSTCGSSQISGQIWGQSPESGEFWNHNTVVMPDGLGSTAPYYPASWSLSTQYTPVTAKWDRWVLKNSITHSNMQSDGKNCPGGTGSNSVFDSWMTNSVMTRVAFVEGVNVGGICFNNPGGTNSITNIRLPATTAAVGFVNAATGDYHLASSSPYSAANPSPTLLADDGADLGADIDMINLATSGAVSGTPSWDQRAGLRVDSGSSRMVFRYTAPTTDACTATIYGAPAHIPGNQVATGADNSPDSISDALARELYIAGLQPSSQYWYKLACGGGVLLVGNLFTRATGQGTLDYNFDWSSPTPMQYSSSANMASPVSLPAANRQFIPVSANAVVYVQEGAAGPITMLIAP